MEVKKKKNCVKTTVSAFKSNKYGTVLRFDMVLVSWAATPKSPAHVSKFHQMVNYCAIKRKSYIS